VHCGNVRYEDGKNEERIAKILAKISFLWYTNEKFFNNQGEKRMKNIKTINKSLSANIENAGCGECQASCQSACKTSCTVANQKCENLKRKSK